MKIRSYLALMAIAVLIPFAAFFALVLDRSITAEREANVRAMQESLRATSLAVDAQWNAARGMVEMLARSPYLRAAQFDGFYEQAKSTLGAGSFYIVLFDEQGQQRVNTSLAPDTPIPVTTEAAGPRIRAVLQSGHAAISNLLLGKVANRQMVTMESPISLAAGPRYVIGYSFDASELYQAIPQERLPADWRFSIFDRDGVSIARGDRGDMSANGMADDRETTGVIDASDRVQHAARASVSAAPADFLNALRQGREGLMSVQGADGKRAYVLLARSPVSGWTTALEVPAAQLETGVQRTLLFAALGLIVAVLCATAAWIFSARRIARAFEGVERSVQALGEYRAIPISRSGLSEADRLNEALAEAATTLETANAERETRLLEAQTGRGLAETQTRAKDQFLAMLGHELRNPLAPISTAAHILKLPGLNEDRLEQTRGIIERQVAHLTRLVDELIDVSRVTRGVLVLQSDAVDLNDILPEAVEQVRDLIEDRHHELTVIPSRIPAWANADGQRMVQVIVNLLHNAAKFTPEAGHIGLTVEVLADVVAVTVKDDGNGIPQEFLPHVFDLFAQSERSSDRSQGGLGLGLSLVKGLVELHGGAVSARSDGEGKGSEFRIEVPRLVSAPAAAPGIPGTEYVVPVLNVVVVDDNVDAAESLAMYLKASFGYRVWVYPDAQSALAAANEHDVPDAFVLDIGLPGMDGYELARTLRSDPSTARAMLIAVTGYGQQRDRDRAYEAGFDYHLTKPADPVELSRLLAQTVTD